MTFLLILPPIVGVSGVIISVLVANVTVVALYLLFWEHALDIKMNDLLKIYFPIILALCVMLGLSSILKMVLDEVLIRLILSVCTGIIVYCSVLFSIYRIFNIGPVHIFASLIQGQKKSGEILNKL